MKKKLLNCFYGLTCILAWHFPASAQWCVPSTIIPYATTMPGITHVILGDIDRTSADLENYPANSYVNTGMSTDLVNGNTYTISITHTIDGSICPDMNIRVWIDYNLDYSFDDVGETVILANHHAAGTYTGTFTVPMTTVSGPTRMRITAKMTNLGGHTLPTPCDFPADPLGYHGEDEDYTVNLVNATGILQQENMQSALSVFPSLVTDHASIVYTSSGASVVSLYNLQGEMTWSKEVNATPGMQEVILDEKILDAMKPGVYFIAAADADRQQFQKIIIQ